SAPKDEAFCCAPGSTVGVDQALACSCGLFFAPSRLNVTAEDWRVFWGGRTLPRDAAWLLDLSRVVPDTRVSVASLLAALAAVPPTAGLLDGTYRVEFQNGRSLDVTSRGTLRLARDTGAPTLSARLGLNDYVARVLDREAAARPMEAARALAIAARAWLVQNAYRRQGCWHIADDSRAQRVSPNPPSEAARRVAGWTDGLVVAGAPVTD